MIRNTIWNKNGDVQQNLPLDNYLGKLSSPDNLIWVDIHDSPYEESYSVLRDIFGFHPLAIDDALEETHVPKIDNWGDYLCIVCQVISANQDHAAELLTQEVDIFIGKNYILSYHESKSETIEKVWLRASKNSQLYERGPANLLYLLFDENANDFISKTDQIDLIINNLEDKLFDNPNTALLEDIFSLKRNILNLRQSISPQREVLNQLARGDYPILGEHSKIYFRDVYDHFLRLLDITENLQNLTSNTLEIFLSMINNRMNGIMKTLTIITTLFMPISFLAGFFGMNFFKPISENTFWTSTPVLIIVIFATMLFPVIMLIYFSRKGWIK